MATLCALITVYHRTGVRELRQALDSLIGQTRPADSFVLVVDGPIPDDLRETVNRYDADHENLNVVTLDENLGAGLASQAGMEVIDADYVARLDSDDIAKRERFAVQAEFLDNNPDVGAVGTAVEEFSTEPGDGGAIRSLPDNPASYARINSPINNPSVMLRADAVREVGGYQDVHFMEDYDLYARLLAGGWALRNLPEALTYFRVSDEQFSRRTGREMFAAEREMQSRLVSYGLIGPWRARFNLAARTGYRLLPRKVLTRVYDRLFHRSR